MGQAAPVKMRALPSKPEVAVVEAGALSVRRQIARADGDDVQNEFGVRVGRGAGRLGVGDRGRGDVDVKGRAVRGRAGWQGEL